MYGARCAVRLWSLDSVHQALFNVSPQIRSDGEAVLRNFGSAP